MMKIFNKSGIGLSKNIRNFIYYSLREVICIPTQIKYYSYIFKIKLIILLLLIIINLYFLKIIIFIYFYKIYFN
jgi:hypothetical protein